MTYGNLPYPDLPTLPIYLSENPYQRRHQPELPLEPQQIRRQHAQPSTSEEEDGNQRDGNGIINAKGNSHFPMLGISNLFFSHDDPERTAFYLPLMILLVVHAMFLFYLHVYAPSPLEENEKVSPFLEYERRFYDVDGLRKKLSV